jgi:hypothetical protein
MDREEKTVSALGDEELNTVCAGVFSPYRTMMNLAEEALDRGDTATAGFFIAAAGPLVSTFP